MLRDCRPKATLVLRKPMQCYIWFYAGVTGLVFGLKRRTMVQVYVSERSKDRGSWG